MNRIDAQCIFYIVIQVNLEPDYNFMFSFSTNTIVYTLLHSHSHSYPSRTTAVFAFKFNSEMRNFHQFTYYIINKNQLLFLVGWLDAVAVATFATKVFDIIYVESNAKIWVFFFGWVPSCNEQFFSSHVSINQQNVKATHTQIQRFAQTHTNKVYLIKVRICIIA